MKMKTRYLLIAAVCLAALGCSSGPSQDEKVTVGENGATIKGDGLNAAVGTEAKIKEADLHVPFYPGAVPLNDKSMSVKTDKEESVLAYFQSTDDPKKIAEFYESKVAGLKCNEFKAGESVNYIGDTKLPDGAKIAVAITKKSANDPVEFSIGYGKESK